MSEKIEESNIPERWSEFKGDVTAIDPALGKTGTISFNIEGNSVTLKNDDDGKLTFISKGEISEAAKTFMEAVTDNIEIGGYELRKVKKARKTKFIVKLLRGLIGFGFMSIAVLMVHVLNLSRVESLMVVIMLGFVSGVSVSWTNKDGEEYGA